MESAKTILVVEDEEQIASILIRQLSAVGYKVITASNAFTGLRKALTHRPDLVIMDICFAAAAMGFSVAERMRGSGLNGTPIVFITGYSEPEYRQEAQAIGAAGFFQKPYNPAQLIDTISRALSTPPPHPSGLIALPA